MSDDQFEMNGLIWHILFVHPYSHELVDRTGALTLATTDINSHTVFLSSSLYGSDLYVVLVHELGHCAIHSYDLLDDIHRVVYPEYWIEAEEWLCNFLVDYGLGILNMAYNVLGNNAWRIVPRAIEYMLGSGR